MDVCSTYSAKAQEPGLSTMPYIELHAHSYFSLLDGVPTPEALIAQAAAWDMPALALTDHNGLYGMPRFWKAAQQAGIKAIVGCELTLAESGGHLTLLAENQHGYSNMCRLITSAHSKGKKGIAILPEKTLAEHTQILQQPNNIAPHQITNNNKPAKNDKTT